MTRLTLTIPDQYVPRILAAFDTTDPQNPATAADVKEFLIQQLREHVRRYEVRAATQAALEANELVPIT